MNKLTETALVERNPSVGETEVSVIHAALQCSPAFPVGASANQHWGMATDFNTFELFTVGNGLIHVGDAITVDGKTYVTKAIKPWPPSALYPNGIINLLMTERT